MSLFKLHDSKPALQTTSTTRNTIVIALLVIGLLVSYLPKLTPGLLGQPAGYTYIADLDFWQRTEREKTVVTTERFDLDSDLHNIPLQIGDWQGQDIPETNQEVMILLEPEQYVLRLYRNSAGQYIWLSIIGGRSSKPFHPPDLCYAADGWQFNLGSHPIQLANGGDLYGYWLQAQKPLPTEAKPAEHVVYYFYLFPDAERATHDGIVLFKLTSTPYGTLEETLELQADFIRQLFISAA